MKFFQGEAWFAALRGKSLGESAGLWHVPAMEKSVEELNHEFRLQLQQEFSRRLRVNANYSIRSFANHIEINSSTLSQILAGKRKLSAELIDRISQKAGIARPDIQLSDENFSLVQQDLFAVISDWYHYAILDLVLLPKFKREATWISRKLGITVYEAKTAVERLLRVGLLREVDGKLQKSEVYYSNYSEGVTSSAHKEYQRKVIEMALKAVDNCPAERKDITSMTIAADSSKLPEAKERLKKFRRELCAFLEDGEKDSVYHLGLQLYPVTTLED